MDSSFSKNQTPEELVSQFKRQGMLDQMRRSLYKDLTENVCNIYNAERALFVNIY